MLESKSVCKYSYFIYMCVCMHKYVYANVCMCEWLCVCVYKHITYNHQAHMRCAYGS